MIHWQGNRATAVLKGRLVHTMTQAGEELRDAIKQDIEVWGPPRSTAGNPPHRDTGALHDDYWSNTVFTTSEIVSRVGSSLPYDPYLEDGTARMADRPHARPTFNAIWPQLVQTIFS